MARFTLDELECDEIHAALIERRDDLNKRKTKLLEDGLPEAADGVGTRLRLYDGHDGPDGQPRAGLVRMFAPQRDIEAEVDQARRGETRDRDGQQDIFGGGAETGGRTKAASASTVPADTAGAEVVDVDFEIIPEGRRIGAKSTITIESALAILAQIARVLLGGPAFLDDAAYDNFAAAVVAVLPALNPDIDPDHVTGQVMEEFRDAEDNAHTLAHYIERNVALIRDKIDNPIPKKPAEPVDGATATPGEELAEVVDDTMKATDPVDDGSADALRKVVFPAAPAAEAAEGREADGGLSFETPPDRGAEAPAGEPKPADPDAKAPPADPKAADSGTTKPKEKGKGKGGRKNKGNK